MELFLNEIKILIGLQDTHLKEEFFTFWKTPIFVNLHWAFMAKSTKIKVKDFDIALYAKGKDDFFSLTDMARYRDADRTNYIIQNWMRTRNAIEFNGLWEQLNNPDFKSIVFDAFKSEAGSNSFTLTPQKWIETTNAIGIISKSGR